MTINDDDDELPAMTSDVYQGERKIKQSRTSRSKNKNNKDGGGKSSKTQLPGTINYTVILL